MTTETQTQDLPPEDGNPEAAAQPDTATQIASLEKRLAEMSDAYLRAKAEGENTRRRAEEDVSKARKFAVEAFAEAMLPVLDSLEAAIALPNASNEQLLEGVHATRRQLTQALERNKVVEINPPAAAKFDPHQHQAISAVPLPADSEQAPNTIVAVLQKGFLIADRVLRPALVTVSAPK
ncbi:MAG: nucleotide exchange factor GrpE [Burkholderiales bacterium]|jgi:molecular chaperone GrpE